jgi:hypothetical protein
VARATKAEHEQRIEQTSAALMLGRQRHEIVAWATGRWGIGERQVDKYIRAAGERISQSVPGDRAYEIALSLRRHTLVFSQAIKDGKLAVADRALHEIDVLRGLRVRGAQAEQLDPATIRKNLKEIVAEHAGKAGLDGI